MGGGRMERMEGWGQEGRVGAKWSLGVFAH